MNNLLTDESPQVYHPTLATWVGLNEAIFLAQLHFILTKNEKVGKTVDGRKWYRDKPREFMVKYFPFWDENTVKRTIINLRNDGLLLARADLNTDKRDKRSLWYSINYPAIERLTGPVERITQKSGKRRDAREARIHKEIEPKVQNVPEPKVHFVPQDKSTICTEPKVQNVPTPKESLPKDSLSPNGDSGQKPLAPVDKKPDRPATIPAFKVYIEVTEHWAVTKYWRNKMGEVVGEKPERLKLWRDVVEAYTGKGWFAGDVKTMLEEYFVKDKIPGQDRQNGFHREGSPAPSPKPKASPPIDDALLLTLQQQAKGV